MRPTCLRTAVLCLLLPAAVAAPVPLVADSPTDSLPRRGVLGAAVGHPLASWREGAVVGNVAPGGAGEKSGLRSGDVVTQVAGRPVSGPPALWAELARQTTGREFDLVVRRDGEPQTLRVTLAPRPLETSDAFDVIYGSAAAPGGRLRTVVTKPRGEGRRPALLWMQGLTCGTVDAGGGETVYTRILHELTRRGYVTMRSDKSGTGDSEGPPCSEIDFAAETSGHREALAALKKLPFVDPEKVFIFGHSMGGIIAPLVISEVPVRGAMVYGATGETWGEYLLKNTRIQLQLSGAAFPDVERAARLERAFHSLSFDEGLPMPEVLQRRPELRDHLGGGLNDDEHLYGRHYRFFQQLERANLAEAWSKVDAAVAAIWGKGDYVSQPEGHRVIADIVNRAHPGRARYLELEGCDHGFNQATDMKDAFQKASSGQPGQFNPGIVDAIERFMKESLG